MKKTIALFLVFVFLFGCQENSTSPEAPDKPVVNIATPQNNSSVSDSVLIKVNATDDKGIVQVEIYIDNQTNFFRTFYVPPYKYLWVLPNEPDSSIHTIYAKAYDGDENVSSSEVIKIYHISIEAPSNLKLESISERSLKLLWQDNSNDEDGFLIERQEKYGAYNSEYSLLAVVGANQTSFTDETVTRYKNYLYRIRAFSEKDTSSSVSLLAEYKFVYSYFNGYANSGGDENSITPIVVIPGTNTFIFSFQNQNIFHVGQIDSSSTTPYYLERTADKITRIVADKSGRVLFGTATGRIYLMKYPDFSMAQIFEVNDEISDLTFMENYSRFAASDKSGKITIFDYDANTILTSYEDSRNSGKIVLAFNPSDNLLINGSESGYLIQWNVSAEQAKFVTNLTFPIGCVRFNSDLYKIYMGMGDGAVRIMNAATNYLAYGLDDAHNDLVTDVKISKLNNYVISAANDGFVKLWNDNRKNYVTIDLGRMQKSISIDATEDFDAVITSFNNNVRIWKNDIGWHGN